MNDQEFLLLKGTNKNDNVPDHDFKEAMRYRNLCLQSFKFDPFETVPLCNLTPKLKRNLHWLAKFEFIIRSKKQALDKAAKRKGGNLNVLA